MLLSVILACAAAAVAIAAPSNAPLSISGRLHLPQHLAQSPTALAAIANTRVILNGGEYSTITAVDGSFVFFNVSAGGRVYLCEIDTRGDLVWPSFKLNVPTADASEIAVVEYRYPGAPKLPAAHPIAAFPVANAVYFEERPKTTIWSFLKNPQVLIMLVMGGFMFCMPALQKNMDPETRKEMEQQQAMMANPMAALSNMFSGGGAADAPRAEPRRPIGNEEGGGKRKKEARR